MSAAARTEFYAGLRAVAPTLLGTTPFGILCGLAAVAAGLHESTALAMSFIVFAGASQIAASQLISGGAPFAVVVFTVFIINLRFMMYSAYLAPYMKHVPLRWRALISFVVTDTGFALSVARFQERRDPNAHWFFFGTGVGLWVAWQVGGIIGILVGTQIPASWSFDFIIPLAFIAMAAPLIRGHPSVAAAVAAGCTALVAAQLPYKLGLVVAAVVGIATGVLVESWTRRSSG